MLDLNFSTIISHERLRDCYLPFINGCFLFKCPSLQLLYFEFFLPPCHREGWFCPQFVVAVFLLSCSPPSSSAPGLLFLNCNLFFVICNYSFVFVIVIWSFFPHHHLQQQFFWKHSLLLFLENIFTSPERVRHSKQSRHYQYHRS